MSKKTCFVIMGYGVKTDYTTGRDLDLDKTYKNIIKPAVEEAGLNCLRADEIRHSGIIDVPMYQHLLAADVVIADLSTYNPNAFYELGVRHALRPFTTIAISEKELKNPFDVNHTVMRSYEHLGKDIGYDEVIRFRTELTECILDILRSPKTDSPVYTFLHDLTPPSLSPSISLQHEDHQTGDTLSEIINAARIALDNDKFVTAKELLKVALDIDPYSTFARQKIALATYKSKLPDPITALNDALRILEPLNPDVTTDPETLGLCGAIHKRFWEQSHEKAHLEKSIKYYERGFFIKLDYYNGINLAYLLNVRGVEEKQTLEAIADFVGAKRLRVQVIEMCEQLLAKDFESRSDQYWILATLEEACFGLGNIERYLEYQEKAKKISKANWERETTEAQINKLRDLLIDSPRT